MKNYNDEGFDSLSGNRRDYGSERNSDKNYTGGYSQAGRKLRHRKNYTGGQQDSDNGYQDSRKSMFSGERRNQYGSPDRRGHSSRFQDGGSRGYGSRDFGERQERSGFGNRRPSQRRSYGEGEGRPDFGGNEGRRFSGAGDERRNYRGSRPAGKKNFGGDARKGAPAGR